MDEMIMEHSVVYVVRHIDSGGNIDIPYKKIGITGSGNATLSSRLQQISNTKSPIKAQCVAAWEHDDARAIENAIHQLLDDSRVEGEWFLDKEDTLVERMSPIMDLIGAKEIEIPGSDDAYTKSVLKKESIEKKKKEHFLIGEISELLTDPLRASTRKSGPTFYSDKKKLTYFVGARKFGNHNLSIARVSGVFDELNNFLSDHGYDFEASPKGNLRIMGVPIEVIAEIINLIESRFQIR